MIYSWKYSAIFLGVAVFVFLILLNTQPLEFSAAAGRIIATVLDMRFLIILVVALALSSMANPLILALIAGVVLSAYLQITLQDHWARLDIPSPSVFETFWPAFLGAMILLSLLHSILGMWGAVTEQEPTEL